MKAMPYHGAGDFRVENKPDPRMEHPNDVIPPVAQCNTRRLLEHIREAELHARGLISHRFSLQDSPDAYKTLAGKQHGRHKAALIP